MQNHLNPRYNHASPASNEILASAREFIQGWGLLTLDKLYFLSLSEQPPKLQHIHFFSIDTVLVYINFYADFGPSNLSQVVRFCEILQEKFITPATATKKICLYSSMDVDKRANAAFLMCAYMMLVHKKSPEESFFPLMGQGIPFAPYRDAGYGAATYHITILDCIRGLHKSLSLGLLDLQNFNVDAYEFYEKVENGDFNWITPKFLALACPKEEAPRGFTFPKNQNSRFYSAYAMDHLIKFMLENNIKTIVRLNNKVEIK